MSESFNFILTHPDSTECGKSCGKITITSTGGSVVKRKVKYSIDGSPDSTPADFPIHISGLTQGTYNIKLTIENANESNSASPIIISVPITLCNSKLYYNNLFIWFLVILVVVFFMLSIYALFFIKKRCNKQ
jgi:hypothetical protein